MDKEKIFLTLLLNELAVDSATGRVYKGNEDITIESIGNLLNDEEIRCKICDRILDAYDDIMGKYLVVHEQQRS